MPLPPLLLLLKRQHFSLFDLCSVLWAEQAALKRVAKEKPGKKGANGYRMSGFGFGSSYGIRVWMSAGYSGLAGCA